MSVINEARGGQGEDWRQRIEGLPVEALSVEDVHLIDPQDPFGSDSVDAARRNLDEFGFLAFGVEPEAADQMTRLQEATAKYFSMSLEEKMRFAAEHHMHGKYGNRGYFPYGTEVPTATGFADPKEYLHIAAETEPDSEDAAAFGFTDFSILPPELRREFQRSYQLMGEVARQAVVTALLTVEIEDVPPAFVAPVTNSVLRVIHYPAMTDEEAERMPFRAAPHKGFHVTGVQAPPRKPGLQYITPEERVVEPDSSFVGRALLVNVATMLADYSGRRLYESPHQVALGEYDTPRYSTVFFHHPDHRAPETYVDDEGVVQAREGLIWGDRMAERLQKMKIEVKREDVNE